MPTINLNLIAAERERERGDVGKKKLNSSAENRYIPFIRRPHPKTDNWTRVYLVLPNIFLYNRKKEKKRHTPFRYIIHIRR